MAEKVQDDFERIRRIELVGKLFLETGYSTRAISKLISNNTSFNFKISNATVFDYIQRYKYKHSDKADQIDSLIEANKSSSITDKGVCKRVYKVAELVLEGYSIEDISNMLGESYWVIYYDIDIRLRKLNSNLYNQIKEVLLEHTKSNVTNKNVS